MKKILALLLVAVMALGLAACSRPETQTGNNNNSNGGEVVTPDAPAEDIEIDQDKLDDLKIGFIFLHDENSTYDLNFIKAANEVKEALGLKDSQVVMKKGIPESSDCYEAAVELAEGGCDLIFADSFGHEDYMIQAATEYPEVQFCHATGTKAHTAGVANFHNAFASIYEGRFLAGIVAGFELNEMIASGKITANQAKIGYVGAMPYAEVKSGMTAFYLGARSVCPTATITVKYTESWYDETKEMEYANALINDGCVLISQHADSMGAPNACEAAGVPNVAYNGSTNAACPETFLVSSRINWAPYFEYIIAQVCNGENIAVDWCGGLKNGSVELSEFGKSVSEEAKQAVADAKAKLESGELQVFATSTWKKDNKEMTTYLADVNTDETWQGDTEVIENGAFQESKKRSAPYFDIDIDGVTTK